MKKQFKAPKVTITPLKGEQLLTGSGLGASAEGLSSGSNLNSNTTNSQFQMP